MINRAEHHLRAAGGTESPVHDEAVVLAARHTHLTRAYRDEATAHARYATGMAQRSRERSLSLDDGLEL